MALDKEFIEIMKNQILDTKEEIIASLNAEKEDAAKIVSASEPGDLVDHASEDTERILLESLSEKEINTLRLINSALARIRSGQYGVCGSCGGEIPRGRLEALPFALLCIACKEASEKKRRS